MKTVNKLRCVSYLAAIALFSLFAAFFAFFNLNGADSVSAAKDFDYYIIVDENTNVFLGINSRNNSNGAVIVSGKAQPSVKTTNGPIISYNLGSGVKVADINGLFCQIEIGSGGNQFAWFYVESSEGVLYRVKIDGAVAYNTNDTVVNVKGTATTGFNFTLPKSAYTVYMPKEYIISAGKIVPGSSATAPAANSAIGDDTVITAFHYVIRSNSSTAALDPARPITVSTIGAVKFDSEVPDNSTVTRLFESPLLTSTADSAIEADVNFGDITKGNKVLGKYCLTAGGSFITTGTEHEHLQYSRKNVNLTVRYSDKDGNAITEPESGKTYAVTSLGFDSDSGGFVYDATDLYCGITGYVKVESESAVTGTVYCEAEKSLIYKPVTKIKSVSAILEERIAMRFNIEIDDSVKETATVSINEATGLKAADAIDNGDGTYAFVYKINAAEMTKNINIVVDNGTSTSEEKSYSFKKYAEKLLTLETSSESLKTLIKATLNYGAYAQTYFNVDTENLANSGLSEQEKSVETDTIENVIKSKTGELPDAVSGISYSLSCKDSIVFNFYVRVKDGGDITGITFTVDGQKTQLSEIGNGWYGISKEIVPAKLSDQITFTLGNAEININPYAYFQSCFNDSDTELSDLVKAMYLYAESAQNYFNQR